MDDRVIHAESEDAKYFLYDDAMSIVGRRFVALLNLQKLKAPEIIVEFSKQNLVCAMYLFERIQGIIKELHKQEEKVQV